jgi:predicted ATPase
MTEVFEQADGVPLFVEELTKAVLETVDRNGQTAALAAAPPAMLATLNASLIARLDRVGPSGKEIAQVGAVRGREFGQAPTEPGLVITVSQRAGRPPEGPYRTRAGGFSGP